MLRRKFGEQNAEIKRTTKPKQGSLPLCSWSSLVKILCFIFASLNQNRARSSSSGGSSRGQYISCTTVLTVLMYSFEVLVLEYFHFMALYSLLPLNYISEGNIVLSTHLHLFDSFSYYLLYSQHFTKKDNMASY